MTQTVEVPLWLFVLIVLFAAVTFASHFLFPSVRWFFRRRLEKAVASLNERLVRPIEPFKLARRHDMIQRLIYDPEVTQAIVDYATAKGVPENVAFQKARRYAREIVPGFSAFAYFGFAIRAARILATSIYDVRTGVKNDRRLQEIAPEATVVFVMNHRSNMDYVLVTYLAARASALSYAVGEWARVWPLSRLIKSMGAYFIRRRYRDALYRRVLARYVQLATEGGVTQAIFPEGGLSLDGTLAKPKVGLLAYVLDAFEAGSRDVVFVPVAINYDRVLEDRVLIRANKAGNRRFGANMSVVTGFVFRKLWLRIRGRFLRFGVAAVVFGEPIRLSDYDETPELESFAQTLMDRIGEEMPLLGVPFIAQTLRRAKRPMSTAALVEAMQTAVGAMEAHPLGQIDVPATISDSLRQMLDRNMIIEEGDGWRVNPRESDLIDYYSNSAPLVSASASIISAPPQT